MLSAERGFGINFKALRNLSAVLLFSAALTNATDTIGSSTNTLYGRRYSEVCTPAPLPIVFATLNNPTAEKEILAYIERVPGTSVNAVVNDRYRVIFMPNRFALKQRHPANSAGKPARSHAGGYTDFRKKEIVIDDPVNFPHELGHGVDASLGLVSTSADFQEAVGEVAEIDAKDARQSLKNLKETSALYKGSDGKYEGLIAETIADIDKSIALSVRLQTLTSQIYPVYRGAISADPNLESYVMHIFTKGFEGFYYPELLKGKVLKDDYPKLYLAMERFNANLEKFCLKGIK